VQASGIGSRASADANTAPFPALDSEGQLRPKLNTPVEFRGADPQAPPARSVVPSEASWDLAPSAQTAAEVESEEDAAIEALTRSVTALPSGPSRADTAPTADTATRPPRNAKHPNLAVTATGQPQAIQTVMPSAAPDSGGVAPQKFLTTDPRLEPSQALRVLVWQDQRGVHVAPLGTVVSAITTEALLVALDPGTDLSAWLQTALPEKPR
jgi:hypothetical protein